MKTESTRYLQLLERRLTLLSALLKTLVEYRLSLVSIDLDGIECRTMEQEHLCVQIRSLDTEITRAQIRGAEHLGRPPITDAISWPAPSDEHMGKNEHIQTALRQIAAAQAELKRLNDANMSLLRRSRYTFSVLQNLLNSYAPTYAMTSLATTGATYEERI